MTLSELNIGDSGVISKVCLNGSIRRRILDVGLTPGTKVSCVLKSPSGEPCAFSVKNTLVALRNGEASKIDVLEVVRRND